MNIKKTRAKSAPKRVWAVISANGDMWWADTDRLRVPDTMTGDRVVEYVRAPKKKAVAE